MDIAVAQQFMRENENAVLATWRRDGRVQMSPVTVGLDGAGRAIISSSETTRPVQVSHAFVVCFGGVSSSVSVKCRPS
jgi:hypothetical protein